MTRDNNKGITSVTYNHLNQPVEVQMSNNRKTVYTYTATGANLKTELWVDGRKSKTTENSGAFVYEDMQLSYINIPDGRIVASTGKYEYNLTDHLGNVRVTFTKGSDNKAKIVQEDHYYPFGLQMSGQHFENTVLLNKFLYNGKEKQDQTGWYDYGFRQLDPQLGRWHVADALAEKYTSVSPYAYALNNPINNIDIAGLLPYQYSNLNIFPAAQTFFGGNSWDYVTNQSPVPIGGFGAGGMGSGSTGKDYDTWHQMGGEEGTGLSFNEWYEQAHTLAFQKGYISVADMLDSGAKISVEQRNKSYLEPSDVEGSSSIIVIIPIDVLIIEYKGESYQVTNLDELGDRWGWRDWTGLSISAFEAAAIKEAKFIFTYANGGSSAAKLTLENAKFFSSGAKIIGLAGGLFGFADCAYQATQDFNNGDIGLGIFEMAKATAYLGGTLLAANVFGPELVPLGYGIIAVTSWVDLGADIGFVTYDFFND